MNWLKIRPWLGTLARLVLGVVWVWSSLEKLDSPRTFVQAVRAYDATPEWLSKAIGYGLPVLELSIGLLLIVGVAVRISAVVSAVLLVVFLIGVIQAAARDLSISCGCFGGGGTTESTSYTLDILRDVGLLVLAAFLVLWSVTRLSLEEFLARHDTVTVPSAKRMRTPEGRRKYEAQLAVARTRARSRDLYLNSSLAVIAVLVTVIGIGVQAGRAKIEGNLTATNATVSKGVVFGKKAAATVDIYEDFGCPNCLRFEEQTGSYLQDAVRANLAQARYHPISILDRVSPNSYSTRAANAALCVSDLGVDEFVAYHDVLYGKNGAGNQVQPAENTAGPSNRTLAKLGSQANLTTSQVATVGACIDSGQHTPLVEAMTEEASRKGVTGTPTVFVNGKRLAANSLGDLKDAIAAADAAGPAPVPSKTPSPSPSGSGSASGSGSPASGSPAPSGSGSPAPSA